MFLFFKLKPEAFLSVPSDKSHSSKRNTQGTVAPSFLNCSMTIPQWSAEPSGRAEMQKFKIKIFGELLVLDLKLHPPGKSTV